MVGIIAAMKEEMLLLKEALHCDEALNICGISFYQGYYNQKDIVIAESGVGKVNAAIATTILVEHFGCDFIMNTGIAGGIQGVETEDIIVANKLQFCDVDVTMFGYALGQVPGLPKFFTPRIEDIVSVKKILKQNHMNYREATIYSSDSFIASLQQLRGIELDNICVAEMEGAAVAQVCVRCGIPFIVLRYVSDIVGKESQIADYRAFENEMAVKSSQICLKLIENFV